MKVLAIFLLVAASFAQEDLTSWDGLYATWTYLPDKGFDPLPRQLSETQTFVLRDDQCADSNSKFRGRRYWENQDSALSLIFDKNGIIAGLQSSIPKDKFPIAPGKKGFVDDGDFWTQTFYFVNPSTICTTGRTKEDLEKDGTGTGLWVQHGPDVSKDLINFPPDETDIKPTLWGSGLCLASMGMHYWFNVTEDMKCEDFFPNCLLYNHGKLTGFCIAKLVYLESPRYDFPAPTPTAIRATLDPVPKCVIEDPKLEKLTSMHVYFHSEPRKTSTC